MSSSTLRRLALATSALALAAICQPATSQTMQPLSIVWDLSRTGDRFSSISTTERDANTNNGAIFYLAADNNLSAGTGIYRLFDGVLDHMDSAATSEGAYSLEGLAGYAFLSSSYVGGLSEIARLSNGSDHVTVKAGNTVAGYSAPDYFSLYGFARYYKTNEVNNTLSAGGITIKSNSVAGGALWSWVWNGIEFIDHLDYGREMQAAVFWQDNGVWRNPTEAGAEYSGTAIAVENRQGAPVIQNSNSGNTQTTRSIPLEFQPQLWGGGATRPIADIDMVIGKDITLDYASMGPVARYVTTVKFGSSITGTVSPITSWMPTSFSRFYTYDAVTQALTEVFPGSGCASGQITYSPPSYGAMIVSNSSQTAAMAIYGKAPAVGGVDDVFVLAKCPNTSALVAYTTFAAQSAGTHTYTHFVTTDTLTNVVANVHALYVAGAL